MVTDMYEPTGGTAVGSVVLFHGLSANKKVMAFNAQEFANQDLRVFIPDFPGHGKSPAPFSPAHAEACATAFVRDLAARRAIIPERTLLAGHSMGAAIAVRVAAQIPVAGTIAISPAPMQANAGIQSDILLFTEHPKLASHSLVLSAAWEPTRVKQIASLLVSESADSTNKYEVIPRTSHVSILFSPATSAAIRSWTSQILGSNPTAPLPASVPSLGCFLGIIGLALLTPPFLREMTLTKPADSSPDTYPTPSFLKSIIAITIFSILAVALFKWFVPFRFLHVFQGDYLASFLFLVGAAVLLFNLNLLLPLKSSFSSLRLGPVAAALILILLFAAWFELTFYEAWLNPARWLRFLPLFLAVLPWFLAEELLLGPFTPQGRLGRYVRFILFRMILWLILLAGIFVLHSGQFAFFLLVLYFVMFSILQRLATDVIRSRTRSPVSAAIFGAILLAGFALAIFPIA